MGRILLVDDDRAVAEVLSDTLTEAGHTVEVVRDGSRVVEELEGGRYGLLLLDVLIPHKNGFTVLEELRGHDQLARLPVIMMSGIYRSRNHRQDMVNRFGVLDYLDKPVSPAKLLTLVETAVGPGSATPLALERPPEPVPLTRIKSDPAIVAPASRSASSHSKEQRLVEPAARHESQQVETESRSRFRTSAFLLQGSIKRNPVAALLGRIWYDRSSGGLLLRSGKVKKIIYIQDGGACAVKSNLVSECLGQILVRERLISEEECAASIEKMKASGQKQGEILVAMRSMTERNLNFALELQLEKKLFETFTWEDGEFRFNASVDMPDDVPRLEWQGAGLVVEGIRRAFDETRLRGLMLPILEVPLTYRSPDQDFGNLGFSSREREAIAAMKLPATARELLDAGPLPPADALRVIYSLIALTLVVPRP